MAVESPDQGDARRAAISADANVARAVAEPRLQWTVGLYDTFGATMAAGSGDAESIACPNLDLGLQIGVPRRLAFFAAELFVISSDGGRAEELLPVVEQAASDNPAMLPSKLAYGNHLRRSRRDDVAFIILREGLATRFQRDIRRQRLMTSVIGYAVLAIDLGDADAAAYLRPIIEPFSADVAFNGVTSQGPVATYVGRLASLLGDHDVAEEQLLAALDTATALDGSTSVPRR